MSNRIPVILTGQALRSLRDSGYSLSAAIAEVVDNSLEAQANVVNIRLEERRVGKGKKHIHRISVSDDGSGMDLDVLHHYPQIGYSTRYMSTTTIGKYGVGAKLAALNYSERLDVWSRTAEDQPWMHVYFDLPEAEAASAHGGETGIEGPRGRSVPSDLVDLLPEGAGTLVVWSKIDRLEEGRHAQDANSLRVGIEKDLSRIFRYFLDGGIQILVNNTRLLPHDPLFLMEGSWADKVLKNYYRQKDVEPRFKVKDHYGPSKMIADEKLLFGGHNIRLRVTVYPAEVIRRRLMGGDELAQRLRVPENEGSLSFVRLEREINYTNVPRILPGGILDLDRFIGIEVQFTPELDEYMGVRNVKRGVEPHGDLRTIIRTQLKKWIPQARDEIQNLWGAAARKTQEADGEHADLLEAVRKIDRTLPKGKIRPEPDREDEILNKLAEDTGHVEPDAKAAYLNRIAELPYVVETVDFPGMSFIDIQHLSHQIIVRLNLRHPFYQELWKPISDIASAPSGSVSGDEATRTARRTKEALTLLVIAYAKAESMDADPASFVELRDDWGKFLRSLMGKIKDVL